MPFQGSLNVAHILCPFASERPIVGQIVHLLESLLPILSLWSLPAAQQMHPAALEEMQCSDHPLVEREICVPAHYAEVHGGKPHRAGEASLQALHALQRCIRGWGSPGTREGRVAAPCGHSSSCTACSATPCSLCISDSVKCAASPAHPVHISRPAACRPRHVYCLQGAACLLSPA